MRGQARGSTRCCFGSRGDVEASPSLALHSDAASLILARIRGLLLPSKEPETLLFVALAVPVAVAVMWMVWRVIVWCVFFTAGFSLWVKSLPAIIQIPILIVLLLIAWPLLLLALFAWKLFQIFPSLFPKGDGDVPRFSSFSESLAWSDFLVLLLGYPLVALPLFFLAKVLAGPQISIWHWLIVFGPILLLVIWLVARIRRKEN
jgi:hypothetical protein